MADSNTPDTHNGTKQACSGRRSKLSLSKFRNASFRMTPKPTTPISDGAKSVKNASTPSPTVARPPPIPSGRPRTPVENSPAIKKSAVQQPKLASFFFKGEDSPEPRRTDIDSLSGQAATIPPAPRRTYSSSLDWNTSTCSTSGSDVEGEVKETEADLGAACKHEAPFDEPVLLGAVTCTVAGTHHWVNTDVLASLRTCASLKVELQREYDNRRDHNAISVVCCLSPAAQSTQPDEVRPLTKLGYVPATLARVAAPLIDKSVIRFQARLEPTSGEGNTGSDSMDGEDGALAMDLKVNMDAYQLRKPRTLPEELDLDRMRQAVEGDKMFRPPEYRRQQSGNWVDQSEQMVEAFRHVMDQVEERDRHLLTQEDIQNNALFRSLDPEAQHLYVRLFNRKGPWFAIRSMQRYPAVTNVSAAVERLVSCGFLRKVDNSKPLSEDECNEIVRVMAVGELRQLCGQLGMRQTASLRREELIDLIQRQQMDQKTLDGRCRVTLEAQRVVAEHWLRMEHEPKQGWYLQHRLFLLPATSEIYTLDEDPMQETGVSTTMTLARLGMVKFPPYVQWRTEPVFETRERFLAYEHALLRYDCLVNALEEGDDNTAVKVFDEAYDALKIHMDANPHSQPDSIPRPHLLCFTPEWVYSDALDHAVEWYERHRHYVKANRYLYLLIQAPFHASRRGKWWERLVLNMEKNEGNDGLVDPKKRLEHVYEQIMVALSDRDWVIGGKRIALEMRARRLMKKIYVKTKPALTQLAKWPETVVRGKPNNRVVGEKSRFYRHDNEVSSVEDLVLEHYKMNGNWDGLHCEGGLVATLFGLLLWDVIFMPIQDVFLTPYQSAPLDLYTKYFYPRRAREIDQRISEIECGDVRQMIWQSWEDHYGVQCAGVQWERLDRDTLITIVSCIGNLGLAAILAHMASNYRAYRGGMPDLSLWRTDPKPEFLFCEVKGPRDRLADKQRVWLSKLTEIGVRAEVCYVVEPDAKSKRKRLNR